MAIDPSIALQVQSPQFQNPVNALAQLMQVQGAQQQNQLAQYQLAKAQQADQDRNALADLYRGSVSSDGTLNRNALLTGAAQRGLGAQIPTLQKGFAEQDKAQREAEKSQLELAKGRVDFTSQVLGSATDENSYQNARTQLASQLGPDAIKNLPANYDKGMIDRAIQQGLTIQQRIENAAKDRGFQLDVAKFGYQQQNDQAQRQVQMRGQDMSAASSAASTAATIRGQNLADARARENIAQGKVPSGYRQKPDGSLEFIPGGPADPASAKKAAPTEFQGKSAAFGSRAEEADRLITNLTGRYSPSAVNAKQAAGNIWGIGGALEAGANTVLSADSQKAEQAQRDFINAILRQESGAAIGASEFDNAKKQYFPQPGDGKEVIAQKAANRKLAVQGLLNNAGTAVIPKPSTGGATGDFSGWKIERVN